MLKKRYKKISNIIHDFILGIVTVFCIIHPIILLILILALTILLIYFSFKNTTYLKHCKGNGIIYGGRGKGKGLLLNYAIRKDKTLPFCNVPYKNSVLLENLSDYFNSISPNTIDNFINNSVVNVKKNARFEGKNVYIDDINIYLPNWCDSSLKKKYPSLPPMLAINRHLYNAYCIVVTQDRERPYKIIKELQTDFSIKAVKSFGFGFLWNCVPLLRYFVYTKYIWYELPKSSDLLPFNAKALVNETAKDVYLTSGQAQKEVFESTHGKIKYGCVLQLKKHLNYDTRYFHKVVYGYSANN